MEKIYEAAQAFITMKTALENETVGLDEALNRYKWAKQVLMENIGLQHEPTRMFLNDLLDELLRISESLCAKRVRVFETTDLVVGKHIGAGQFGQVFRAQCCGNAVAVKEMSHPPATSREREILLKELEVVINVHAPHIANVYGVCFKDTNTYIVMDLLDMDLKTAVESGVLRRDQKLLVAYDVAQGLRWMASMFKCVHRDIKPQNILLDRDGRAYLTDFGFSRFMDNGAYPTMRDSKGTPFYMPPEALGGGMVTAKMDVYAFGMVLYFMFAGQDPFIHYEEMEGTFKQKLDLFRQRVLDGERPDYARCRGMPQDVVELMRACWAARPEDRPDHESIAHSLKMAYLKTVLGDDAAVTFWNNTISPSELVLRVPLETFCAECALPYDLMRTKTLPTGDVTLPWLRIMMLRHGKFFASKEDHDIFVDLLGKEWFHGDISQAEAMGRLENKPAGTFLVRYSKACPSKITVSVREETQGDQSMDDEPDPDECTTENYRMSRNENGRYVILGNEYGSVQEFIELNSNMFIHPASTSEEYNVARYFEDESDEEWS